MEYWEFLLQQEGDQNWLPLDTAQVEILEGRYRIMAHTSQANTPVHIQISQQLLEQLPPKRRTLRRQGQTNADGLMVVLPFTRLVAGTWDIYCFSLEAASDGLADEPDWAFGIQLQVLAQGSGDDEWFIDEGQNAVEDAVSGDATWPQPHLAVASAWSHLDLDQVSEAMNRAQQHLTTAATAQGSLYQLGLYQAALAGHEGESVGLQGQVTGVVEGESCSDMALVVRLSDPQTAEQVAIQPFSLPASSLPAKFNLPITIPPALSTRLLLGEVGLVLLSAGTVSVLALQRFTVTVNLASLFDAIANQAETETVLTLDFAAADGPGEATDPEADDQPSDPSTWSRVSLPKGPPRSIPGLTLPRSGFTLPPKIYYPSPHEVSAHRPTLPPLSSAPGHSPTTRVKPSAAANLPTDELAPEELGAEPSASSVTAANSPSTDAPSRPSLSLPPLVAPPTPAAAEDDATDSTTLPAATITGAQNASTRAGVPQLPSHEAAGFRDLKVGERFWTRLNDLAITIQQEAQQKRAEAADSEGAEAVPTVEPPLAPPSPFAGEVVIYEDEDETLGSLRNPAATPGVTSSPEAETEMVAPPVPVLELPAGELTAGEPVMLTVRVPFHPNRFYIKVWITDPQTRSLVDEPRQLMHLLPNGQGQLEGSLQLIAPLGCLEAQFEAISVDLITQQESYKASVSRTIVPAGLTSPSLEDLEL